ncbi:MAG: DHH family phosphoesterase, partial [Clostridia bacterium]|nr:DHH family phosphoesterase [Clostridia bacterium]
METPRNFEAIARCIREAQTVAVVSHVTPDGDTLGSAAAMRLILQAMGKKVTLFCDGKVPDILYFMPGHDLFHVPTGHEGPFDLMLAVDVSDSARMGTCAALMDRSTKTAQMDHHPTNPGFADVNLVDGKAPANCMIIRELMKVLDVPLTQDIA